MAKKSAYFTLSGIHGTHDVEALKHEIDMLPGVTSVSVNSRSDFVAVDFFFDTTGVRRDQIKKQIEKLGYTVADEPSDDGMK